MFAMAKLSERFLLAQKARVLQPPRPSKDRWRPARDDKILNTDATSSRRSFMLAAGKIDPERRKPDPCRNPTAKNFVCDQGLASPLSSSDFNEFLKLRKPLVKLLLDLHIRPLLELQVVLQ
jgi:hypothetical protein